MFGDSMMGKALEALLVLSVLSSAAASTQNDHPADRAHLAGHGCHKALPSSFAKIHPKYLTPTVSTIWMGIVSIAFYVGLSLVSQNVLSDSIAAVGLMIAFYYGLTGFAAVWFLPTSSARFLARLLHEGSAAVPGRADAAGRLRDRVVPVRPARLRLPTLFGIGGVFIIGIGALLLGVVLMYVGMRWHRRSSAARL